jgi:2-polyprenyl-3-methyl-5-hydroxy-6-metoxy-1,4-benzoquinol methylase
MKPTRLPVDEFYDAAWDKALSSGKEDFGDLECVIALIRKTCLVEMHHEILEFGCGIGKLCSWLKSNGYDRVTGIDISRQAVSYGLERYPGLNLVCTDADSFPARHESLDICLSFDFLEHLHDVRAHLRGHTNS